MNENLKEIPILFSTEMVQAILAGRKTMTRRIVKEPFQSWMNEASNPEWWEKITTQSKWQPGDLLWVRETISRFSFLGHHIYKADNKFAPDEMLRWKPSIHMPKKLARIWLQVENIKVERLQDISQDDAISEGIEDNGFAFVPRFFKLWAKINGDISLIQNPWVWVVKFKVLSTTGKPAIL